MRTALLAAPALALIAGSASFFEIAPIFAGALKLDYDPAYVYLLNGLNLLKGAAPGHYDHPGTPLQMLCAVVIFIRWALMHVWGATDTDLTSDVLQQPETYIASISFVLLALNAGALYFAGRRTLASSGNVWLALMVQATPFVFASVVPALVFLAPEALLLFTSLCLLGVLAPAIFAYDSNVRRNRSMSLVAGGLCGLGLATKLNFFPAIGLLILLRARREVMISVASMLSVLAVLLIPIVRQLSNVAAWIVGLTLHRGLYGSGAEDIIDASAVPTRLMALVQAYPLFFAVAAALALKLIIVSASLPSDKKWDVLLTPVCFLSVIGLGTAAVLKHFAVHYLIPILPVSLFGLAWLASTSALDDGVRRWDRARLISGALLTYLLGILTTSHAISELNRSRSELDHELVSLRSALEHYPDAVLIGTYRCILPECALMFGLGYTQPVHDDKAARVLPNFMQYNPVNKKLRVLNEGWVSPGRANELIARGRTVLALSSMDLRKDGFVLQPIYEGTRGSLDRVIEVRNDVP